MTTADNNIQKVGSMALSQFEPANFGELQQQIGRAHV